jgi:hypothetical protein
LFEFGEERFPDWRHRGELIDTRISNAAMRIVSMKKHYSSNQWIRIQCSHPEMSSPAFSTLEILRTERYDLERILLGYRQASRECLQDGTPVAPWPFCWPAGCR